MGEKNLGRDESWKSFFFVSRKQKKWERRIETEKLNTFLVLMNLHKWEGWDGSPAAEMEKVFVSGGVNGYDDDDYHIRQIEFENTRKMIKIVKTIYSSSAF